MGTDLLKNILDNKLLKKTLKNKQTRYRFVKEDTKSMPDTETTMDLNNTLKTYFYVIQ